MSAFHVPVNDGIAELVLNRAHKGNALSAQIWNSIPIEIPRLDLDESVQVLIICVEGTHFCICIELSEFTHGTSQKTRGLASLLGGLVVVS